MYCISIFTRPRVFLAADIGDLTPSFSLPFSCTLQLPSLSLMLEDLSSLSGCILEGLGNWEMEAKGSVTVLIGLYLSPSILEVIPAGCPAHLNFTVKSFE